MQAISPANLGNQRKKGQGKTGGKWVNLERFPSMRDPVRAKEEGVVRTQRIGEQGRQRGGGPGKKETKKAGDYKCLPQEQRASW